MKFSLEFGKFMFVVRNKFVQTLRVYNTFERIVGNIRLRTNCSKI